MKNNISKSLSKSLQQERERVHDLNLNKFDIAEKAFATNTKNNSKKTIRDTFSLPKADYDIIEQCKKRLLKQEISVTKSEVIRIGLKSLQHMSNEEIKSSYDLIQKVKVGRPKNS